jgi:hypothetical protein
MSLRSQAPVITIVVILLITSCPVTFPSLPATLDHLSNRFFFFFPLMNPCLRICFQDNQREKCHQDEWTAELGLVTVRQHRTAVAYLNPKVILHQALNSQDLIENNSSIGLRFSKLYRHLPKTYYDGGGSLT